MKRFASFACGVIALFGLFFLTALPSAHAAIAVASCGSVTVPAAGGQDVYIDINGKLCVNATVSATATIVPFQPVGYSTVTATNVSADIALPSNSGTVTVDNTGTTAVSCNLTVGAGTATASQTVIQPGSGKGLAVGSATHISCIDQTGSTSNVVVVSGGSGQPAGWGGGSGGSSVNGSVSNTGAGVPVQATYVGINTGGNLVGWTGAVTNAGTFAVQAAPSAAATWALGATAAAVPANAQFVGMSVAGNLTGLTGTGGNLNVQCANCTGSGASATDEAAFTAASSVFAPAGGFFQTTATSNQLSTGQQGMWQMTAQRAGFVNMRNSSGVELGTTSNPFVIDANSGGTLMNGINAGAGATGSAPPTSAILFGTVGSGATGGLLTSVKQCDQSAFYDASTSGSTLLVTGVASRNIYVCGFMLSTGGTATNLKLVEGTTTTTPCDTGTNSLTPAFQLAANDARGMNAPFWNGLRTGVTGATTGKNLCINASAANAAQAVVFYTIL